MIRAVKDGSANVVHANAVASSTRKSKWRREGSGAVPFPSSSSNSTFVAIFV